MYPDRPGNDPADTVEEERSIEGEQCPVGHGELALEPAPERVASPLKSNTVAAAAGELSREPIEAMARTDRKRAFTVCSFVETGSRVWP